MYIEETLENPGKKGAGHISSISIAEDSEPKKRGMHSVGMLYSHFKLCWSNNSKTLISKSAHSLASPSIIRN